MAGTLEDLANLLKKEQTRTIPVSSLTAKEKELLGVKEGQETVTVTVARSQPAEAAESAKEARVDTPVADLESISKVVMETPIAEEEEAKEPEVEVSPEDLEDYLRTILGLQRFKKSYMAFDKRLKVTFRTRTAEENMTLIAFGGPIRARFGLANRDAAEAAIYANTLLFILEEVQINGVELELPPLPSKISDFDAVQASVNSLLSMLPVAIYKKILTLAYEFGRLVTALDKKVNDINF